MASRSKPGRLAKPHLVSIFQNHSNIGTAQFIQAPAQVSHIVGAVGEGKADHVGVTRCKFKIQQVFCAQRRQAERRIGEVDALTTGQFFPPACVCA